MARHHFGKGQRRALRCEQLEDRRMLATITVDTLADTIDFNDGKTSLREAIFAANTVPGADEIVFDASMFATGPGTILLTHGELTITDSMTITGPGPALLTIDASGNDPTPDVRLGDGSRVFAFVGSSSAGELHGLTITGGDVLQRGGGVRSDGPLTIDSCVITENESASGGGGVYCSGDLLITDSTVDRNFGNVVARSVETSVGGGGVAGVKVTLVRTIVADNLTERVGGGVAATNLLVDECVIVGNTAEGTTSQSGRGGGLYIQLGTLEILSSLIRDNKAINAGLIALGGGAYVHHGAPVTIRNSTFVSNFTDGEGGGLAMAGGESQELFVVGSTFSRNTARWGASISAQGIMLAHSTLVENVATTPLGAAVRGIRIFLDHSIVARNYGSWDVEVDFQGVVSASGSLIGSSYWLSLRPQLGAYPNVIGWIGTNTIDPRLGPLQGNGGSTLPGGAKLLTHAPLSASPAIDAGDPALVPGIGSVPEFDQRGAPYSRLTGARVDIGAVEAQGAGGALTADFNFDGRVDGSDFLAWQRGVRRTGVVTIRHGDATADGDVDANDLAVWMATAGDEVRGQESGVSERGGELPAAVPTSAAATRAAIADAVFTAGEFSGLFTVSESPSSWRGKWRPARRG